jgi:hypothetical protein
MFFQRASWNPHEDRSIRRPPAAKGSTESPNDYFGQQLRQAADEETKKCRDFAARKEAEKEAHRCDTDEVVLNVAR